MDALSGGVRGVVENEIAGAVPNSDGGIQAALSAMGTMQSIDLLRTNFTLALIRARQMRVFVSARTSGMPFFPDTTDSLSRIYSTRDRNQVREFIQDLNPVHGTATAHLAVNVY